MSRTKKGKRGRKSNPLVFKKIQKHQIHTPDCHSRTESEFSINSGGLPACPSGRRAGEAGNPVKFCQLGNLGTPPSRWLRDKSSLKIFNRKRLRADLAAGISFVSMLLLFVLPLSTMEQANAATMDQINGQINQVTNSLNAKQAQANSIQNEISAIDNQAAALQAQIDQTAGDISKTTADIDYLNQKIAANKAELKKQRDILNEYLTVIYENSNTPALEQIAGANNFSDFVDQAEYLQTMQLKAKEVVDKIRAIQDQLNQQRHDLDKQMASLKTMQHQQVLEQQGLNNQLALKNNLLAQANADATNLQGQLNSLYAQKAAMSAQFSENVMTGGGGGYPYGNPPPSNLIDTPDAYGYLIGECTSYAAWWRAAHGRPVPRAMGNAAQWAGMANGGPNPGAVAVFPYIGGYGHVAIVEAVYGNGTILISEYNWTPYSYDERVINPYDYGIVYIN